MLPCITFSTHLQKLRIGCHINFPTTSTAFSSLYLRNIWFQYSIANKCIWREDDSGKRVAAKTKLQESVIWNVTWEMAQSMNTLHAFLVVIWCEKKRNSTPATYMTSTVTNSEFLFKTSFFYKCQEIHSYFFNRCSLISQNGHTNVSGRCTRVSNTANGRNSGNNIAMATNTRDQVTKT